MSAQDNLSDVQFEASRLLKNYQGELPKFRASDIPEIRESRARERARRKSNFPTTPSDWTKEHNEATGVTYQVHGPSGVKVWNTYRTTAFKWQIEGEGSGAHGEVFKTAQEAKHRVETNHQERQERQERE